MDHDHDCRHRWPGYRPDRSPSEIFQTEFLNLYYRLQGQAVVSWLIRCAILLLYSTAPTRALVLAALAYGGWWSSRFAIGAGLQGLPLVPGALSLWMGVHTVRTVADAWRNPRGLALFRGWRISRPVWSTPHFRQLLVLSFSLGIVLPCALPLRWMDRPGAYSRAELALLKRHHARSAADYAVRGAALDREHAAAEARAARIRTTLAETRGRAAADLWGREDAAERTARREWLRRGEDRERAALAKLLRQGEVRREDR